MGPADSSTCRTRTVRFVVLWLALDEWVWANGAIRALDTPQECAYQVPSSADVCYEAGAGADALECAKRFNSDTFGLDLAHRRGENRRCARSYHRDYSSLIEVTFRVSPCTSPLTST